MSSTFAAMQSALETFEAQGIPVTDEMRAAVESMRNKHLEDSAIDYFTEKKGHDTSTAVYWQEFAFNTAGQIAEAFAPDIANRGRGRVSMRSFSVETPEGTLKVSLSEVVRDEE